MVKSEFQEAVTAVKVKLVTDAETVVLDCLGADLQHVGDLFAGAVFGDQF